MVARILFLAVALAFIACRPTNPDPDAASDVATADADASADDVQTFTDAEGTDGPVLRLRYESTPINLAAGAERGADCESWTLNNSETLYVNTVTFAATAGMHHSNWFFVPLSYYRGPDGRWPCSERAFDQGVAAAAGGVLFAQSTQTMTEVQQFQPGVVVPVPPYSRVVGQVHMLNVTSAPIDAHYSLELATIPREDVTTRLAGLVIEYNTLSIPPRTRSDFTVECDYRAEHMRVAGRPLDMQLYYGLPHYHTLATLMRVQLVGGPNDGQTIFETRSAIGEPLGRRFDPLIDLTGASGLRLLCEFNNPRSTTVRYGIGSNEMCVFFAFTNSDFQWATGAQSTTVGNTVTGSDGGVVHNTAPCTQITLPTNGN